MNGYNAIIIGAAGYVAPRHVEAIKATGGNLLAAVDPFDSVGYLDRFFPEAKYFREIERLDRYLELIRSKGRRIDYVSICSPNYLHDAHCRFALRIGATPICEKPLTLNVRNINLLRDAEKRFETKIKVILQLRLSNEVERIKEKLIAENKHSKAMIRYITPRGQWYSQTWKADPKKSGGLATNIGIHLIDLCCYFFGPCRTVKIWNRADDEIEGTLFFVGASVNFLLSIRRDKLPERTFKIDDDEIDLSRGFEKLHQKAYREIISGRGFGIDDIAEATAIAEKIRGQQ